MKRATMLVATGALALAVMTAAAQVPAARVADDAKVLDRVAQASKKDLPRDLLRRIVDEDVDLLRGKRSDGTYQYAGYERLEGGRVDESFSVQPKESDQFAKLSVRGDNVYRLVIALPSRRLLVTKNRKLYVDRVEIEAIPQGGSSAKTQSVPVGAWLEPGSSKTIELDEIARHATANVFARGDKDAGYGNVNLTLVQAKIFDNPDSPYADSVSSLKAIQRALDNDDIGSIRAMASRIQTNLRTAESSPARTIDVIAPRVETVAAPAAAAPASASADLVRELQEIEDLLTGTEAERRQGTDRLHQLLRRMRSR